MPLRPYGHTATTTTTTTTTTTATTATTTTTTLLCPMFYVYVKFNVFSVKKIKKTLVIYFWDKRSAGRHRKDYVPAALVAMLMHEIFHFFDSLMNSRTLTMPDLLSILNVVLLPDIKLFTKMAND
uniref:Uncharacterized protein n=1 Tax=Glossina austeni TaxID=7395 RepID=A0A1A9VQG2_GLOAU